MNKIIYNRISVATTSFMMLAIMLCGTASMADTKELSAAEFLRRVRTPPLEKTWAQLSGEAVNMKRDKSGSRIITRRPIDLGIRFTTRMILTQIVIGNDEIYSIGQPYAVSAGNVNVIRSGNTDKNTLKSSFGIRPEDLTMSFIFWKLEKELPETSFSMVACRVFLLKSPEEKQTAKVYIGRDSYFPVKVEWFKPDSKKPVRTLEVDSFRKVNGLYLVDVLQFSGPGWRTKIDFSECKAGYIKDGVPEDLFRNKDKTENEQE